MTTNRNDALTIARIEELQDDLALNFKQICELLVLVKKHYLHRDTLFQWYREVAHGSLIPEIVICMALKRQHLKHMIGRPREVQLSIARDTEFDWCSVFFDKIILKRTSWKCMRTADFIRMFPAGGAVRTVQEQRAILEEQLPFMKVTHVHGQPVARADAVAHTFTLGRQTVPISIVLAALREANIKTTDMLHAA